MSFYRNNFLCKVHEKCGVGASCAIDVLLEFFFHSVYKKKGSLMDCQNGLQRKLNDACLERDRLSEATCESRHMVWDWLVENLPESYAPKGRGDAEILQAFRCLSNESDLPLFQMRKLSQTCAHCGTKDLGQTIQNPLYLPVTTAREKHGYLPDCIREILSSAKCCHCKSGMSSVSHTLPEYFMIELGIVNRKNNIPTLIPEVFVLDALKFELVGAVLVRQDHFYCIVKHNAIFMVMDDLKDSCPVYQSFSGAMTGNRYLIQDHHVTTNKENGIHILIYSVSNIFQESTSLKIHLHRQEREPSENRAESGERQNNQEGSMESNNVKRNDQQVNTGLSREDVDLKEKSPVHGHKTQEDVKSKTLTAARKLLQQLKSQQRLSTNATQMMDGGHISQSDEEGRAKTRDSFGGRVSKPNKSKEEYTPASSIKEHDVHVHQQDADSRKSQNNCSLLGNNFSFKEHSGKIFLPCKTLFQFCGLRSHINKEGFKFIDKRLERHKFSVDEHFLYSGKLMMRDFISVEAFRCVIQGRFKLTVSQTHILQDLTKFINKGSDKGYTCEKPSILNPVDLSPTGVISLDGMNLEYKVLGCGEDKLVALSCKKLFSYVDMNNSIKKNGYKFVDKALTNHGLQPAECFVMAGYSRQYITAEAFLAILDSKLVPNSKKGIRESLIKALIDDVAAATAMKKQLSTPARRKFITPVTVFSTPQQKKCNEMSKAKRRARKKLPLDKSPKTKKGIQKKMTSFCFENFNGSTKAFMNAFATLIKPSNAKKPPDSSSMKYFNGKFDTDDITYLLQKAKGKKSQSGKRLSLMDQLVHENAGKVFNISAAEYIYMQQNLSGCRLFEQFRQRVPGVFPSRRLEISAKKDMQKTFFYTLLPRRTATGWRIDPARLLEVLCFKYYGVQEGRHWKVYGDGREIGGRQSTFIALSMLNNAAYYHDQSFHNPKNVYPCHIFYESDSRDNLEENLGHSLCPSSLHKALDKCDDDTFYLSGDEMFLEAVLDGDKSLGPTTETGWNIYRDSHVKSKCETSTSGLRTELKLEISRAHPSSLLPAIPISRTVLCTLHAVTRCVEKFLNLEILNILSEGNKETQRGRDGEGFKETALQNLEANISHRGVRQGNFRILFDSKGNPEPVSLNKDHAVAIITDLSGFQHVLTNVVNERPVRLSIPLTVRERLGFKEIYTELDLVKAIWSHFHQMYLILQKDPLPQKKFDRENIEEEDEHSWGYSEDDKTQYLMHAERFYQLYCERYTAKALTPYMMKLIDHVPELMEKLPFPLARFQSEGGEHANYEHNTFYNTHTTRHGGKGKPCSILAQFQAVWNRLSYEITQQIDSDIKESCEAGNAFMLYCSSHCAATVLQKYVRGYVVRKKLQKAGWCSIPLSGQQKKINEKVKKSLNNLFPPSKQNQESLFDGSIFVFFGPVPKQEKKRMTQEALKKLIEENGGRVRTRIPFRQKGISTKTYTVLTNKECCQKKVPSIIRIGIRRSFPILDYSYVFDCVENRKLMKSEPYKINTQKISSQITKDPSLQRRHFNKSKTFISLIKKARKVKVLQLTKRKKVKVWRTAAQYFVSQCLKTRTEKLSSQERRKLVSDYFQEWKILPEHIRSHYKALFLKEKAKATAN